MKLRNISTIQTALIAVAIVLFVNPILADDVPVAQVFRCDGAATVRAAGATRSIPLTRGMVLASGDRLDLKRGAEVGLYFRQGGRQVVRGGTRGLSGTVAQMAPALQPYRGQSVSFGATRGERADTAIDVQAMGSSPVEPIELGALPRVSLAWNGLPTDAHLASRLVIRAFLRETVIAEAALDHPVAGSRLELAAPAVRDGEEYRLEVTVVAQDGTTCTHTIPIYVAVRAPGNRDQQDFLTGFFFRQDAHPLTTSADLTMLFEQELSFTTDSDRPLLAITIAPSRPAGIR